MPSRLAGGLPRDTRYFTDHLRTLALELRSAVMSGIAASTIEELAEATVEQGGDTIYRLDEHGEGALLTYCSRWAEELPFLLVAEGLESGEQIFPPHADPDHLAFTLIVDPIDGTRELMYGKRSAWTLLAIAPAPRQAWHPTLCDIRVAVQAELPTGRAALADMLWAARGEGVEGETHDLRTGTIARFVPRPSQAPTLDGGFAAISKFFPGSKVAAAKLEEALFHQLLGPPSSASPQVFDDEYISSGGQLYELMVGHDRFLADLRPLLQRPDDPIPGLSCHPYDLCTWVIAVEAGVIVTDERGGILSAPLSTTAPVAWIGYANEALHHATEPVLMRLLQERGAAIAAGPQGPDSLTCRL